MKKIIALLAVFALLFSLCYTKPIKAADGTTWSLPFSSVKDLIQIAEELFSGAEVDLATISNQMLGLYDYVIARKDYLDDNNIYIPELTLEQSQALNIGLSALALDGQTEFTALSDLTIPIPSEAIAHFINYRPDWIKRYKSSDDVIVVNPDVNYLSYLDTINGSGYFFSNFSQSYTLNGNSFTAVTYPFNDYSWFVASSGNSLNSTLGEPLYLFPSTDILDIYITSQNNLYSYSINCNRIVNAILFENYNVYTECYDFYSDGYWRADNSPTNYTSFSRTFSGTLSDVLDDIALRFRNVNIYVDGVLWSYAGSNIINDPFVQLGLTAIGDLGTSTYPVYALDRDSDLGLDVGAFANWLDGVIRSGATALSLEDLIDDGIAVVDTTTGQRAITDDDSEDVTKVIAGAKVTTAPSGSPTPTPDPDDDKKIPILKIIPPILDPVDDIWPDGGRDTTVLAQIIHSTDVILPDDIMTILWSILGVMVVGGLLMILHK